MAERIFLPFDSFCFILFRKIHNKYPLLKPPIFVQNNSVNPFCIPFLSHNSPPQNPFSVFREKNNNKRTQMALKAVHVSDVPSLDQLPEDASIGLYSTRYSAGLEVNKTSSFKAPKFLVVGHRGNGMNDLQSSDNRMRSVKENSILSFNSAAKQPIDFIEFDVQVTKDDCPIIFHDNFIISEDNGTISEKRVTELCLSEFLAYGPQKEAGKKGKNMLRKTKEGKIVEWNVEIDDSLCTLQEAFQQVETTLGFNIELKFDDHIVYQHDHLIRVLQAILKVVFEYAKGRPIIFSSFQPDAALLVRKLQNTYPVFFLTNGGTEIFYDERRNSLEEAIKVCSEGGLQGIVSEVKGILGNPGAVTLIKDAKLSLLTYGKLNNVAEAVYMQHLMGIDGVIVDLVQEITHAVSDMIKPPKMAENEGESKKGSSNGGGGENGEEANSPKFSKTEISFLLKLIPKLLQI